MVKLEYILESTIATASAGTTCADYIGCNSAFEPYSTNKILGFGQYTGRYADNTVESGHLTVKATPGTTPVTAGEPQGEVILIVSDTNINSYTQGAGNHGADLTNQAMYMPKNQVSRAYIGAPGTNVATVHVAYKPHQIYGFPKADPGFRSANNSAPTNLVYGSLSINTIAGIAATIQSFSLVWTLTLFVRFSQENYSLSSLIDEFAINRAIDSGLTIDQLPIKMCGSCSYLKSHPYRLCDCRTESKCGICCFTVPCTEQRCSKACPLRVQEATFRPPVLKRASVKQLRTVDN